jgi:hypothetical protein
MVLEIYTIIHTLISLVAIFTGFIVVHRRGEMFSASVTCFPFS